jgi:crossover junction endodeoxyribonuclease RuvC
MSAMISLGIDIGLKGAIAELNENGELIATHDMPCLADGPRGRSAISAPLLAEILARTHAIHAYVEHVGPRPLEGAVGGFAFGRCKGVIEGALAVLAIPVTFLTPPTWKRLVGIPPGRDGAKDMARSEAIRRWPSHAALFALKKSGGRAEAALIAVAGIKREGAP